jgi:hypothetical protein
MIAPGRETLRGRRAARALEEVMGVLRALSVGSPPGSDPGSIRAVLVRYLRELRDYLAQNRRSTGGLAERDVRLASLLPVMEKNRKVLMGQSHELCRRVRESDGDGALQVAEMLFSRFRE